MRNKAIDIQKGIGIILVVLGHNWVIGESHEELFRVIYSFHVPLFFFLSGVLFKADVKFWDLAIQKWQSILKPYFVVLIGVAINVAIWEKKILVENFIGIFFATGQSILWVPMWFLPHLFISIIFSWWFISKLKLKKNEPKAYLVILAVLVLGLWVMGEFKSVSFGDLQLSENRMVGLIGLPFSADLVFVSSAYLILGYVLSFDVKDYKLNKTYLAISLALFSLSHYFFNEAMNLNFRIYGNPFISTVQAVCGIYFVVALSELLKNVRAIEVPLSYIGSGSMFVLIFHGILQGKAISKIQSIFPSSGLMGGLLGLIASIACSLLLWELAKRIPIASNLLLPTREKAAVKT